VVSDNRTAHIQNQGHMTKVVISHKLFLELMRRLDVEWLRRDSLMVIDALPVASKFDCWKKPDQEQVANKQYGFAGMGTWEVPRHGKVHVLFVDVGLSGEATTRRVHLRSLGKTVDEDTGQQLADKMVDVMERAMAHVRMLDCHNDGCVRPDADSPEEAYDVAIWICDLEKVVEFRKNKAVKAERRSEGSKLLQSSDNQHDDSWHADNWQKHSWNDEDWSQGNWKKSKWL
jgi:hypothetical protein